MDTIDEVSGADEASGLADRRATRRAARSLAASVAKLHGAVRLPAAAQQLLRVTNAEDYALAEVVRIVESDPSLAGHLLGQVNGAEGARIKCLSVAQAVTYLGTKNLRATAIAASALQVLDSAEEPRANVVVEHGTATGTIARSLAPHCGLTADEMYTCGLLLDVGKLLLLRGADLDYGELLAHGGEHVHLEERKRYGFDHAVLGGGVLAAWKLPHPLPRVVTLHHQPARAFRAPGNVPKMVALVRLADRLAHLVGRLAIDDAVDALASMKDELAVVGFSPETLRSLCAELASATKPAAETPRTPPPLPPESEGFVEVRSERTLDEAEAKATVDEDAPVLADAPATVHEETTAAGFDEATATGTDETFAGATDEATAEATDEATAEATDETLAEATDETLAATPDQTLAEATDEATAATPDQATAATPDQATAATPDEATAATADQTTAATTDEPLAAVGDGSARVDGAAVTVASTVTPGKTTPQTVASAGIASAIVASVALVAGASFGRVSAAWMPELLDFVAAAVPITLVPLLIAVLVRSQRAAREEPHAG